MLPSAQAALPPAPTPIDRTDNGDWPPPAQTSPATSCSTALKGSHATYNVGPGQTYTELTDVPWLRLQAGDVVNIHYRSAPYRTKFGLRAQGTARDPIVINGVTDSTCKRPEISGANATTAADAQASGFGQAIEAMGLIQIYRLPTDPWDTYTPDHITIQNLKLTGARRDHTFTNQAGDVTRYDSFSAAIYAVRVHHLTVENCEITGNGLGVFTNTKGSTPQDYSAHVIIRRNVIHFNGNPDRQTEHNLYVQARRALYEGNFIGQAYGGSSLKDRSSGTVIRYNKILASARALDLVETEEENHPVLQQDPLYPHAWVYGNIIINDHKAPAGYAVNLIHWAFDNTQARSRTGTLFFYANTLVNKLPQATFWYFSPFQIGHDGLADPGSRIEASSNIFWQQSDTEWRFLSDKAGSLQFRGRNYVPRNWYPTTPGKKANVQTGGATLLTGQAPLLDANLVPRAGSPVLDQGGVGPSFTPAGATAAHLLVTHQYREGAGMALRPVTGSALDLGALERP
ncbi:MAG: hypothetical protein ACM3VZ_16495 [Acidobacteriota bacterium]